MNGRRILVVEDEVLVSMLLEDMLAEFGCSVVGPAPSLSEAMPLAHRAVIDAAVLQKPFRQADLERALVGLGL